MDATTGTTPEQDWSRCSHITATLADPASKSTILKKYKSVVAWNVYRSHELKQPPAAHPGKVSNPLNVTISYSNLTSAPRCHLLLAVLAGWRLHVLLCVCIVPMPDVGQATMYLLISRMQVICSVSEGNSMSWNDTHLAVLSRCGYQVWVDILCRMQ